LKSEILPKAGRNRSIRNINAARARGALHNPNTNQPALTARVYANATDNYRNVARNIGGKLGRVGGAVVGGLGGYGLGSGAGALGGMPIYDHVKPFEFKPPANLKPPTNIDTGSK
jgi:hypothetical protein